MDTAFHPSAFASAESLDARFHDGLTFDAMMAAATENGELFRITRAHAVAPPEFAERIYATGRRWHLLVISEDWCGDAPNIVPFIDALAASSTMLEARSIARDENLDLMDRHLTNGRTRSIPIALLLDDRFVERAWWGPRPLSLQEWFETAEAQALTKVERYKQLRTRYARDRGRTLMGEITQMIESVAAQDASAASATAQAAAQA